MILVISNSYAQDADGDQIQMKRMSWFYNQRAFPMTTISQGAYSNAITQVKNLREQQSVSSPQDLWKPLGPAPGFLSAYISGRVSTLKFSPGDPTGMTFFLGAADGGVWKTTNGGQSWTAKTDFLTSLSSGALAIGQNENGQWVNIYYGTGESHAGFNFCYYGDGFFKSTDNGDTWMHITDPNLPSMPTYFQRIIVNPLHPNEILAACGTNHTNMSDQGGLYRSTDYGNSWTKLVPNPRLEGRVCNDVVISSVLLPNGNQMAYAIGPDESSAQLYEKGIHYQISTDGGASFTQRDDIIFPKGRSHIALCRDDPNRVYILTQVVDSCSASSCSHTTYSDVLFTSTDAGFSFTAGYGFLGIDCNCGAGDAYQSWYDMFVYCSPTNNRDVYVGLIQMWKSTDAGVTFHAITPVHSDMQNMDIDPNNSNHIILGSDGGIYSSPDGGSLVWNNLNNTGINITQIYRVASSPFDPEVVVAGAQDNGIQSKFPSSTQWNATLRGGNDGTQVVYSQINPDLIFGGYGNYRGGTPPYIIRSTDGGNTFEYNYLIPDQVWDSQNDWIPPITSSVDNVNSIETFFTARRKCVDPSSNCLDVEIKIYYTNNEGVNWNEFGSGIHANESPQELAISKSNTQIMYLSTGSYAWPYISQNLYKSVDGANSWTKIVDGLASNALPNRYITHLEIDPADENMLYVTYSGYNTSTPGHAGHLYRTKDGGNSWSDISGNLPDVPVNDFVIQNNVTKCFIVATDAGVLISSNGGSTWQQLASGLPNGVVDDLEYHPLSNRILAATYGRGVWADILSAAAPLDINYTLYLNSGSKGVNVDNDLIIESGGKLKVPFSCTINMAENKKIIVKNGGSIDISSGAAVNFSSQSGKWGGIEIQGTGCGNLANCTFNNCDIPLTIEGNSSSVKNKLINISNCIINKGSIVINSGNNVTITGCTVNNSSGLTSTGIFVNYGKNILITKNTIHGARVGISVSNSSSVMFSNTIDNNNTTQSVAGISLDNNYFSQLNNNVVTGYVQQICLFHTPFDIAENPVKDVNSTKEVKNGNSNNQLLFAQAVSYESLNKFEEAVSIYRQIVRSYNSDAVIALKRIMYCYDKMNVSSDEFDRLRNYLLSLSGIKGTDDDFVISAKEIAVKCLVKSGNYIKAINEYEKMLTSSADSAEVLRFELNIIETYMASNCCDIQNKSVNSGNFTELKPANTPDGIRMINEKLHHFKNTSEDKIIPSSFSLSQNYPNPFNPSTMINFGLPYSSKTSIKIYDMLGRVVKELVNEFKDAGYYSVAFDGSNLSSGVYFYRIEAGKFIETRKMVLMK